MKRRIFLIPTLIVCTLIPAVIKSQPLQNRLLIATSSNGLNFQKTNKILYNFADVPDAVVTSSNQVYVYFQGIQEPLHDIIMVGISSNGIDGWSFQPIKILGTENWPARPCDPDVIYKNGKFRIYFTGDPLKDQIPETYSAISDDGINFTLESGIRFSGGASKVLDPSLLWIGDSLHYFAGGGSANKNWHAVSMDGLYFTKRNDFSINELMMSNGIITDNGYRFYGFSNKPPQNIQSVFSADGKTWNWESGIRLERDVNSALESAYVKDPAVVIKDLLYIMYYVTRKPEYTGIEIIEDEKPREFELDQNYPNPFNPNTTITYNVPTAGYVALKVYDVLGREIAKLVDEFKQPGIYNSQFSIRNYQLPSGVYFYALRAGGFYQTKKMILMK